jgi:plastocyanin
MRRLRNAPLVLVLALALATPILAGDLHGTVKCPGARDSADAVVYVDAIPGRTFPAPKEHAVVNQMNLSFGPHVLPVLVGTTVDFLNSDSVLHNVFTPDSCAEKFNLGSWPKGERRSHTFRKECFVSLLCMVHPEMEGFVAALPTPWYAVTGPDGSYRIADVADGEYMLKVWHPKLKPAKKSVQVRSSTAADFELSR